MSKGEAVAATFGLATLVLLFSHLAVNINWREYGERKDRVMAQCVASETYENCLKAWEGSK